MTSAYGIWALTATLAAAPPPELDEAPGGYYQLGESREREPVDGENKVFTGGLLLPLGLLRAGAGAGMAVMAAPTYCKRIYGPNTADATCNGLKIYGFGGVGIGGLMAATGAVLLAWGLTQRARHAKWMRDHGLALAPLGGRGAYGLSLGFRF